MSGGALTRGEQVDLQKLARMRAKVARNQIDAVKAERLAEFERELQARYAVDNEAWADLTRDADEHVRKADEELAKRCEALGIRPEFRPRMTATWYNRGENASKERQAELRRLARLELDAMGKTAKQRIDAAELDAVTAIVAVGMGSEARALLEAMPEVGDLIPALALETVESKSSEARGLRAVGGGL
ncbi:MAG: hypothetical protein U0R28_11460 [Candidatus Nanopelagicales bacterium]